MNRHHFRKISPFPSLEKRGVYLSLGKGGQEGFWSPMSTPDRNPNASAASFLRMFLLVFLFVLDPGHVFSQPVQQEELALQVRLESIDFRVREIPSSPAPVTLFEVHVSVFNPSPKATVPANSITLEIVPREITFLSPPPKDQPHLQPEITTLNFALAPRTGRLRITAFSLPMQAVESLTFDIQINPPKGERKTATWRRK